MGLVINLTRSAHFALAVGLALRIAWALLVPVDPVSDSAMYDQFARSIAAGRGYAYADGTLTAFWPVGTSAVYGALYRLAGPSFNSIVVLNVALGGALIWLGHLIARRAFGNGAGIAAAWILALWPLLIQFTTVLASELLFTFLLMAALCAAQSQHHWAVRAVAWAALLSAAMYVRPIVLPLFAVFPLLQWWRDRRPAAAVASLLVAIVTATIVIGPWALRNQEVLGKAVPVSTNFGANLWMGNNPRSDGAYMPLLAEAPKDEVAQNAWYRRKAVDFIERNPLRYLELTLRRAYITFSRETIGVAWNEKGLRRTGLADATVPLKILSTVYWLLALGLALSWMIEFLFRRRGGLCHPLWVTIGLLAAVPLLTVGQDRYHIPLIPLLAALAGAALANILRVPTDGEPER